jgi:hypothetical protein
VNDQLTFLRELRHVLLRLGARPTARYWANGSLVFVSNLLGGAAAGAVAFICAAILLSFDLHRGPDSLFVHVVRALQTIAQTLRAMVAQELR